MAFPVLFAAISNEILNGSVGLTSFSHTIQDKLDNSNYLIWRSQVLPTLRGLNLLGFVDGILVFPPEFIENSSGTTPVSTPAFSSPPATADPPTSACERDAQTGVVDKATSPVSSDVSSSTQAYVLNPKFILWIRQDQLLFSWLLSTFTQPILGRVINCCSSAQVWDTLKHMHAAQTQARVLLELAEEIWLLLYNMKYNLLTRIE
ncbi:hypothetical protein LIER_41006 [Lithospermum erythrorhizon]|uniref:Retrotransposon Copia-like N-terminal domain-containing protein n=1 Tax=Lithospermum erythrorhizon TaxID=34254 RepID=A0AAV3R6H3_LITER